MSGLLQTIKIKLETIGTESTKALKQQVDKTTDSARKMSMGLGEANGAAGKLSDQGLANIQAGLVQLSTYLMIFNQGINNAFDKALVRFKGADEALNRLRITMGLTGKDSIDALGEGGTSAMLGQYKDAEAEIDRLAMTTKFTKVELADLFRTFAQAGKGAAESKRLTDLAQQLSAAGGGLVSLEKAGEIILKTEAAVGVTGEAMVTTLDRMLKASQTSRLGLEDMSGALSSLRGAMQSFGKTDVADAQLFAFLAAYKTIGLSPENAADSLKQVSAGMADLYSTVNRFKLRTGMFNEQGGIIDEKALKKAYGRANIKRNALLAALGITDQAAMQKAIQMGISKPTDNALQYVKDQMARQIVSGPGGAKLDATAFTELVLKAEENLKALGMGGAEVESTLKTAFGVQSLKTFKNAVQAMQESTGKSFREVVAGFTEANGALKNASDESLKSLESRLKLLESAEDALSNSIFQQDIVANGAIDTYTAMVSSVNDLIKAYPSLGAAISGLGRGMQITTGVGTNLGFMLTAAATFSIGLSHAQKVAGVSTKGLGAVLGSFHKVFLAPTLSVVLTLGGAFILAGLGLVAFMQHISGADSIGEGFKITLQNIKDQAETLTAFLKMAFSGAGLDKDLVTRQAGIVGNIQKLNEALAVAEAQGNKQEAKSLQNQINDLNIERQQYLKLVGAKTDSTIAGMSGETRDRLMGLAESAKAFFDGMSSLMQGVLMPLSMTIGSILSGVVFVAKIILTPFIAVISALTGMGDSLKIVGALIGTVFSVSLIIGVATAIKSLVTGVLGSLTGGLGRAKVAMSEYEISLAQSQQKGISRIDRMIAKYELLTGKVEAASARLGRNIGAEREGAAAARLAELNKLRASGIDEAAVAAGMRTYDQQMLTARQSLEATSKQQNKFISGMSKIDALGQKPMVMGAVTGITLLSGVAGMAADSMGFSGLSGILNGLTAIMSIVSVFTMLASTGFFTLAASVIAATWPILAVVAAITAVIYAYKQLTKTTKAEGPKTAQQARAEKAAQQPQGMMAAVSAPAGMGVAMPAMPGVPSVTAPTPAQIATITPASSGFGGFTSPQPIMSYAPKEQLRQTTIQALNINIENKGNLDEKAVARIAKDQIEVALNDTEGMR